MKCTQANNSVIEVAPCAHDKRLCLGWYNIIYAVFAFFAFLFLTRFVVVAFDCALQYTINAILGRIEQRI